MISSTPFNNSLEVFEWLQGFINFEKDPSSKFFRLERMEALAALAGNPEKAIPAVHVAGSKGKGSVTGMAAAIMEAAGLRTARYTSPHVSDFRERLCYNSRFFEEGIYAKTGNALRSIIESFLKTEEEPSFFELMTLWFFLCARDSDCRAMAVETGMGGRLDATNILISPLVTAITVIELEHTEYLGQTIAAIAGEKAGIIKPGRPLVLAEQKPEALEVFRYRASEMDSPLYYFPECGQLNNIKISKNGTKFDLELKNPVPFALADLQIPIPGEVQAKNAGLAVLSARLAFPNIGEKAVREGLRGFTLPARFEKLWDDPVTIIDGAHTQRSIDECAKTFASLYGEGGILIFGCVAGKDAAAMAQVLMPHFSHIIITMPGTFKKSHSKDVYDVFLGRKKGNSIEPDILFYPETDGAISRALDLGKASGLPILGAGSFYLAAEIRRRYLEQLH
ncbi:bifunctional folylpolyglutamate synthase/dihydrofolate synthase [Leadbettera azotonutricia]|uniref:Dihydrofolate synthase/folylpolyglutamate synthase n=1 Tax=Leadbettera azotonutricia (strain ATCC BAA-888 / DSM 13862 / ZAS-9) TaxID=545695 RepID=F5YAC8_LEAAZ|nr:Mur ligase family protein [Leadbettera azotonutricia]AEF80884.1 tetrahydrofolate synthase [Leadbettera azotonutricia ZAS-9]